MSIEVMKQALKALESDDSKLWPSEKRSDAITALRAAIEQGEKQEPVAWYDSESGITDFHSFKPVRKPNSPTAEWIPLYTAPRQEPYDQTSLELCNECGWKAIIPGDGCLVCARQKAKPVWIQRNHLEHAQREPSMCRVEPTKRLPDFVPLYTAPRQWVGLTDEDYREIYDAYGTVVGAIWATNEKLMEKNT